MKISTWIAVAVVVLVAGWYWMSQLSRTNTGSVQPSAATAITLAHDATLGDYLVATNGMTLYRSTKDTAGVSNCSGACAVNWPPYTRTAAAPLVAGTGVSGTLATLTRADGSAQITYNGIPLYFWKGDTKAGDTTGQGVGGYWFVVKP